MGSQAATLFMGSQVAINYILTNEQPPRLSKGKLLPSASLHWLIGLVNVLKAFDNFIDIDNI